MCAWQEAGGGWWGGGFFLNDTAPPGISTLSLHDALPIERGRRLAEGLETGLVWVNCWLHRDLRVPFGGVKNSGVGREGGRYSLEFFSEPTSICLMEP